MKTNSILIFSFASLLLTHSLFLAVVPGQQPTASQRMQETAMRELIVEAQKTLTNDITLKYAALEKIKENKDKVTRVKTHIKNFFGVFNPSFLTLNKTITTTFLSQEYTHQTQEHTTAIDAFIRIYLHSQRPETDIAQKITLLNYILTYTPSSLTPLLPYKNHASQLLTQYKEADKVPAACAQFFITSHNERGTQNTCLEQD